VDAGDGDSLPAKPIEPTGLATVSGFGGDPGCILIVSADSEAAPANWRSCVVFTNRRSKGSEHPAGRCCQWLSPRTPLGRNAELRRDIISAILPARRFFSGNGSPEITEEGAVSDFGVGLSLRRRRPDLCRRRLTRGTPARIHPRDTWNRQQKKVLDAGAGRCFTYGHGMEFGQPGTGSRPVTAARAKAFSAL